MRKTTIECYVNGEYTVLAFEEQARMIDVIREELKMTGTKEGCSDGDCGACTVVLGSPANGRIEYRAVASCLEPAIKLQGVSLITIEGIQGKNGLNLIQEAIVDKHGAQCGFCSPGIVMSLFGLMAEVKRPTYEQMKKSLEGNICRCTGYEGIKEASKAMLSYLEEQPAEFDIVSDHLRLIEKDVLAMNNKVQSERYRMPITLEELATELHAHPLSTIISGNTDLGVRSHITGMYPEEIIDVSRIQELKCIKEEDDHILIGGNLELEKIAQDERLASKLPIFREVLSHMASTQIRNVATIAGNICNASPIGDCIVLLMALDASVLLFNEKKETRALPLRTFYTGYKQIEKHQGEVVIGVLIPKENYTRNISFMKSSKRVGVDIATVNSVSRMKTDTTVGTEWEIAFGGVGPTVQVLKLPEVAKSAPLTEIKGLGKKVAGQFKPLDDVRGSSQYRSLLIEGHVVRHFMFHLNKEIDHE